MAGIGRYGQHLVKVDATAVDQLVDAGIATGNDLRTMAPLDKIEPSVFMKLGQTPVIRFSTTKVGTVIAAVGIDGIDCGTGFEIGYAERAQAAAFEAAAGEKVTASKCFVVPDSLVASQDGYAERAQAAAFEAAAGEKVTASKCFVVPDSLVASQDGYAVISYLAHCYSSDGAAAPLGYANSLPSGTPAVTELFIQGGVKVNSTPIGAVLGFSIAFNIGVQLYRQDGKLYATALTMPGRMPVIEVDVADMGELSAADLAGAEVSDVAAKILKLSTAGAGLAGSGDKTFTLEKSFLEIVQTRASVPGDAGLTMRATSRKGSAAIIAVS